MTSAVYISKSTVLLQFQSRPKHVNVDSVHIFAIYIVCCICLNACSVESICCIHSLHGMEYLISNCICLPMSVLTIAFESFGLPCRRSFLFNAYFNALWPVNEWVSSVVSVSVVCQSILHVIVYEVSLCFNRSFAELLYEFKPQPC